MFKFKNFLFQTEIKSCPFCGKNKLKLEFKTYNKYGYIYRIYSIRCLCCKSRGPTIGGNIIIDNEKIKTLFNKKIKFNKEKDLIETSILKWNSRTK